ncbi:MAG: ATP synthase F1 subunit delta [Pseudomonadota bacterium]
MASNKTSGLTASRYAQSLVDIADSKNIIESIENDMKSLDEMVSTSEDFALFLKSPLIQKSQKQSAISAIAKKAKLNEITHNFLSVLIENGRLNMLPQIIQAVYKECSTRRGEVIAEVATAFPMNDANKKELEASLEKSMGQKVAVNLEVKEDLIGGMVVTVGSKIYDASVKRKLERLKIAMMSGANTNNDLEKSA